MRRAIVALAAVTLSFAVSIGSAHAFDLTGHWIGKLSCKVFDGEKFTVKEKGGMEISQNAGTMSVTIGAVHYNGMAIPDDKKPDQRGEAALVSCPTSNVFTPDFSVILRASVKTKANSWKASFKGVSIFADNTPEDGSCKYSYKRVDTLDPLVPPCP